MRTEGTLRWLPESQTNPVGSIPDGQRFSFQQIARECHLFDRVIIGVGDWIENRQAYNLAGPEEI
jgi:hypothetical protein